jgi:hypothetical protein
MASLSPANAATLLNIDLGVRADRLLQTMDWKTADLSAMSLEDKKDLAVALLHLANPSKKMKNLYDEEVDITALRDSFKALDVSQLEEYRKVISLGPRDALLFYLFKNRSLEIWGPWMKSFERNPVFERLESPFFMFLTAVDSVKTSPPVETRLDRLLTAIKNDEDALKWLLDSLNQKATIERLVAHGSPALRLALRVYLSNMMDYPGVNIKTNANLARYVNSPGRFTGGRRSTKKTKRRQSRQSRQSQSKRRRQ